MFRAQIAAQPQQPAWCLLVSTTLLVSSSQLDLALDGATAPGWALLGQTECRLRNICGFMGTVFVCVWVLSADASDQFCFYLHSTINGKLNSCMHRPKFVHRSLWQRCSAVFCAADEPSEAPCWAESNSIKCGSLIKK